MCKHTPQPPLRAPDSRPHPRRPAHEHEPSWPILSVGWRMWSLWHRKNLARQCQVSDKGSQPETPPLWMSIRSCSGNSLPDLPFPDFILPDVPSPEAHPDGSVGEECNSPHIGGEAMVVAFRLGSGSCLVCFLCSNLFIRGIDYYTRP